MFLAKKAGRYQQLRRYYKQPRQFHDRQDVEKEDSGVHKEVHPRQGYFSEDISIPPQAVHHTVAVKTGRMFSYFAYTRCDLLHFLVYSNVVYTIRKSKLWVALW
jgi:hypothetical protein